MTSSNSTERAASSPDQSGAPAVHYEVTLGRSIMLIVDPQVAFGAAVLVPDVERALFGIRRATGIWRAAGGRVVLTRQIYRNQNDAGRVEDFLPGIGEALRPGSSMVEFHRDVYESWMEVVEKTKFSALVGTRLEEDLKDRGVDTVVVGGLTTPICVQATVDSLNMAAFRVVLIEDACASQALGSLSADEAHRAAIERMRSLFAEVSTVDAINSQIMLR